MDVIETPGVPEFLADAAGDIKLIEGVARIPLLARRDGHSEIVVRVAIPISELPEFIQSLVIAVTEAAKKIVKPILSS